MTTPTPDNMTEADILREIWKAQAVHILNVLRNSSTMDLKASHLDVARKFLHDNGINKDTLSTASMAENLRSVMQDLPFKDDLPFPEGGSEGA